MSLNQKTELVDIYSKRENSQKAVVLKIFCKHLFNLVVLNARTRNNLENEDSLQEAEGTFAKSNFNYLRMHFAFQNAGS